MKKITAIIAILSLSFLLAGCTTKITVNENKNGTEETIDAKDAKEALESKISEFIEEAETLGDSLDKVLGSIDNALSTIAYDDSDKYSKGAGSADEDNLELEINWVAGSVTFEYYDGDKIIFEESAESTPEDDQTLRYLEENGKLTIQYSAPGKFDPKNFKKDLKVRLPKNYSARELTVNTLSAAINAEELSASEADFETISGDIRINDMNFYSVEAETVSGNILLFGTVHDSIDIDSVSGYIMLALPESTGFTCEFSTISGAFFSVYPTTSENGKYVYGDGSVEIDVDTGSANLDIEQYESLG